MDMINGKGAHPGWQEATYADNRGTRICRVGDTGRFWLPSIHREEDTGRPLTARSPSLVLTEEPEPDRSIDSHVQPYGIHEYVRPVRPLPDLCLCWYLHVQLHAYVLLLCKRRRVLWPTARFHVQCIVMASREIVSCVRGELACDTHTDVSSTQRYTTL